MLAIKPENIDFTKQSETIKTMITKLVMLHTLYKQDIEVLSKKTNLNDDEKKILAFAEIELPKVAMEIEAKYKVFDEYQLRCKEMEAIEKAELNDYNLNFIKVRMKAVAYEKETKLPIELRKHLAAVLNQPTTNYSLDQKIAMHLALKKEVELCQNYLS